VVISNKAERWTSKTTFHRKNPPLLGSKVKKNFHKKKFSLTKTKGLVYEKKPTDRNEVCGYFPLIKPAFFPTLLIASKSAKIILFFFVNFW